MINKIYF